MFFKSATISIRLIHVKRVLVFWISIFWIRVYSIRIELESQRARLLVSTDFTVFLKKIDEFLKFFRFGFESEQNAEHNYSFVVSLPDNKHFPCRQGPQGSVSPRFRERASK